MSDTLLVTSSGLGKELCDLLIEKLGIPDHVQKFTVHFSKEDFVTVDCVYYPAESENKKDG